VFIHTVHGADEVVASSPMEL